MKNALNAAPEPKASRDRVLVTGCAGFLGSQLAQRLLEDGTDVVGIDCFTDFYPRPIKEGNVASLRDYANFELRELDLASDPLDDVLDQVDGVYHLAAQAGVRGSFGNGFDTYLHDNVRGVQRLLEATVRHPVDSFVYASSSSVYGNAASFPTTETTERAPVSPYGMTKCATEDLVGVYGRIHGVPSVGLRYFTVFGPRQRPDMAFSRFIAAGFAGEPITVLGDGMQVRDFTYVDDVLDATLAAAHRRHNGGIYNVGGGTPVTLLAAVHLIEELIGRSIAIEHRDSARGDARQTSADTSLARKDLDFSPAVSLEEGLARQVEWMSERRSSGLKVA